MDVLELMINERHSIRMFLPRPVPLASVDEALVMAQRAPSKSTIRPWHLVFASGAARDRLKDAPPDVARRELPNIPAMPEAFRHCRQELGAQVYGIGMGIAREDKEGRTAASSSKFEFLGAPLVGIVCIHGDRGPADAGSVGMSLQTLLLAKASQSLIWGTLVLECARRYDRPKQPRIN